MQFLVYQTFGGDREKRGDSSMGSIALLCTKQVRSLMPFAIQRSHKSPPSTNTWSSVPSVLASSMGDAPSKSKIVDNARLSLHSKRTSKLKSSSPSKVQSLRARQQS